MTRFSIRTLMLIVALLAALLIVTPPLYRYVTTPNVYIQRSFTFGSSTTYPVVSMNALAPEDSTQHKILLLHRQTKDWPDLNWRPVWFEPHQTADGIPLRGSAVNDELDVVSLYPNSDASLTVVYASDDDEPAVITVPYADYASIKDGDTITMWEKLVE